VLSIANYNMHCGMDGWGRPYDYVAAIAALDADVVVLEEAWTVAGDDTGGQSAEAARHLGYQIEAHTLGSGRRIRPQPATATTAGRRYHDRQLEARPIWKDQKQGVVLGRRAAGVGTRAGDAALAGGRTGHLGHCDPGAALPAD